MTQPITQDAFLQQYAQTNRFRLGEPVQIQTLADGSGVFFLRSGPRDFVRDLYFFDAATGAERVFLTAAQILQGGAESLSVEEQARRERMRMAARGIATYQLSPNGQQLLVPLSGRLYLIERSSGAVSHLDLGPGGVLDPKFSPNGQHIAFVRDNTLWCHTLASRETRALTRGASERVTHGLAEFVAQEEMDRMDGYWWSPDSQKIAYEVADTTGVERLQIGDPSRPERPAQQWPYPRAGRQNARVSLRVVTLSTLEDRHLGWDAEAFPYLAKVTWQGRAPLTALVQNRLQNHAQLLTFSADGAPHLLHEERDPAWLNIDPSVPRWRADGTAFLWSTEREGAYTLELRAADGSLTQTLTPPALGYRRLLSFDSARQRAVIVAGDDPRESQLYQLDWSQGAPEITALTTPGAEHSAVVGAQLRVVTRASDTEAPTFTVYRDQTAVGTLTSAQEAPLSDPHPRFERVDTLETVMLRPRDFVEGRKYPVILHVYGGPHAQMVTRGRLRYAPGQWMADQGFVVVSIDGRGTPHRGRAWERAIFHHLGDVPLADQVRGLRGLAARHPALDLDRVGVFGWSFGGYLSAMAMLGAPEVFRAGVAGAPVADWRDYDTHYTERYMGLPDAPDEAYTAASLLTHAAALRGPLLVTHGTADDNVFFLHGLKLSNALFEAGRAHEFLPLVGHTHAVTDPATTERLYRRVMQFFTQHLAR